MNASRKKTVSVIGTTLAALLAHLPCCGPTVLLAIGGASAGLGWLRWLEPWRPLFLALSFAQLGVGFWLVYRKPSHCHEHGDACTPGHTSRRVEIGILWAVAALVITVALLPHHHS